VKFEFHLGGSLHAKQLHKNSNEERNWVCPAEQVSYKSQQRPAASSQKSRLNMHLNKAIVAKEIDVANFTKNLIVEQ
jgi:hypothetical protein